MNIDVHWAAPAHAVLEFAGIGIGAALYRRARRREGMGSVMAPGGFAILVGLLLGAGLGNKLVFLIERPDVFHGWFEGRWVMPGQSVVGGFLGGLLGVELADGVDCFDFLNRLRIVLMATHLGDTRSLALPAAHTIYYEMGAERRKQMGIADSLIRVSVGIEDETDLLFDFDQALNGCLQG